jgi:tRNA threonylcarbamoyladenosine biosynthesis protein TsaB
MNAPLHLAIDTSASKPAAAVMRGEEPLAEWLGPGALQHHETLLAGVDECLRAAGLPLSDLHYLTVGVGPGLFTGLRIGVVTAKFLADPLGLPCVAVSSLLALAWQASASLGPGHGRIWALGDAKSRRVYALPLTAFAPDYAAPEGEEVAVAPEEAAARMRPGDLLAGEGALLYRNLWPAGTHVLPEEAHALTARAVGALGARRYALALTCSATELAPKYLKTGQPHL